MGLIPAPPKIVACLLIMGILIGSAVQAQVFSAKNLGGLPILDEDGKQLSTSVGRVELRWGTNLINQPLAGYPGNRLVRDGYFAFGDPTVPSARAYTWIPITVRAWNSSVGETYLDAVAAGHGYASVDCYVLLETGSVPPYSLADLFPGLRLLSPLPHLQMTRGTNGFSLEVSGEYGQLLRLYGSLTPIGPWDSFEYVIGHGRAVPLILPLDLFYFDFISRGPAN